jgi:hypothetical protein
VGAGDVGRWLEGQGGRGIGIPAHVAALGLGEERLVATGDVVGRDSRERAAGPERVGDLVDPHGRVDPVERGRGQDNFERLRREGPVLERGGDDLDAGEAGKLAPGDGRQLRTKLHGDDPAAPLGQRQRCLPCPRADLQHPGPGSHRRQLGQVVEQRRRIPGPGPVVQPGSVVKGRAAQLPILLGHAWTPPSWSQAPGPRTRTRYLRPSTRYRRPAWSSAARACSSAAWACSSAARACSSRTGGLVSVRSSRRSRRALMGSGGGTTAGSAA